MPKIRSARGEVFDTDRMSSDQIISAAARLEDYQDDIDAAEALMAVYRRQGSKGESRELRFRPSSNRCRTCNAPYCPEYHIH